MDYEFDKKFEEEFARKTEEIAMYQPVERITLDGEWTYDELAENIRDECMKSKEHEKYKDRAVRERKWLNMTQLAEGIIEAHDLIDVYNKEASKDRSKYGIAMFDKWIHEEIAGILKSNLVE